MREKKNWEETRSKERKALLKSQVALISAEEFALSMVPLLMAVNGVGGIAKAISILKAARGSGKADAR